MSDIEFGMKKLGTDYNWYPVFCDDNMVFAVKYGGETAAIKTCSSEKKAIQEAKKIVTLLEKALTEEEHNDIINSWEIGEV